MVSVANLLLITFTIWYTFWYSIPSVSGQDVGKPPPQTRTGGTYRRPLGNDPATLDPARVNDIYGRAVSQQIYDGLVEFDESLAIKPGIARSWKSSRDGLVWTFFLRRGVRFHHGREVTSDDFVYSFSRLLSPQVGSGGAELFFKIKGAREFTEGKTNRVEGLRTLDRYTLQITLTESSTPFISALAVGYSKVVPREVVERLGNDFGSHPVGTGPFKLERWERGKEIILTANDEYYEGRPNLDTIHFRIFPGEDVEQIFDEFRRGRLEDSPIPAKRRAQLIKNDAYQYIRRPILGIRFLSFNNQVFPLNKREIRQAITHAVDRKWIAENVYENKFLPAVGILPPGTYGYDPGLQGLPYDPDRAKVLLAKAGFPGGRGLPRLELWSAATYDDAVAELNAIQRYLANVGIELRVRYNTNWPQFKNAVYTGKYSIFRYSWYADSPDPYTFLYLLLHSKGPHNFTRYSKDAVDRLLSLAVGELDYLARVRLYKQAEKLITQDAPILVLGYYSYERLFHRYVKGVQVSALGNRYIPMNKIWLDNQIKPRSSR